MHKRKQQMPQKRLSPQKKMARTRGLCPEASKLGHIGFIILLAGLGDIGVRLHSQATAGATGIMLRMAYDFECIAAGMAIWVGGILLLDYMERQN